MFMYFNEEQKTRNMFKNHFCPSFKIEGNKGIKDFKCTCNHKCARHLLFFSKYISLVSCFSVEDLRVQQGQQLSFSELENTNHMDDEHLCSISVLDSHKKNFFTI